MPVALDEHGIAAHVDMRRFRFEDLLRASSSELAKATSCACTSTVLRVAGGNAHIAARVLNVDRGAGANLRIQHLLVNGVLGHARTC